MESGRERKPSDIGYLFGLMSGSVVVGCLVERQGNAPPAEHRSVLHPGGLIKQLKHLHNFCLQVLQFASLTLILKILCHTAEH